MARRTISILTTDAFLQEKTNYVIQASGYLSGYSGPCETQLIQFLQTNTLSDHFVLIKPHENICKCFQESFLRSFCKVNVVILGPILPQEHIGLVQNGEISGYLTPSDINPVVIKDLVFAIERKGYLANQHIPQKYWNERPKGIQQVQIPKFTDREKEILFHLCHGFTNAEIAEILKSSTSNIRNHVERIKAKSNVQSSLEMVAISISNSWIKLTREKFKRHNPFVMKNSLS